MKKIIPEYTFSEEQLNRVEALAKETALNKIAAKILYARGVDTAEKAKRFLNPGKENFLSPFLMKGMKECIELIKQAKAEEWNVVIFGDYDADGICAATILAGALKDYGIEPYVFVPEREDGYGLSVGAIDGILDEFFPDLFITVDCGISNAEQAKYLQEQGVTVVVSDHHELPKTLPNCICINPKIEDDYPYDNLCGAGVAFKIAVALLGKEAYKYLDYAALATVADSVPLTGENRDIVAEGLKIVNSSPRQSFLSLLGKNDSLVTAQTLAYTLAPRINAAGRMGNAKAALNMFLATSPADVFALAAQLNEYNIERQTRCDEVYAQAKELLKEKGAYGNVIMLASEKWNSGFVGIVAARIAEEYCRPTILFVKKGDTLKGSARSIENINIFDALTACAEYIDEFGGHAQAAGINLSPDKFDLLERALNEYIGAKYAREDFVPKICVAEDITEEFPHSLAKQLDMFEPYGVGNRKPLFTVTVGATPVRELKANSPHIAVKCEYIELIYFNGARDSALIESELTKKLVFECNLSVFRGKEYVKGFIRDVEYNPRSANMSRGIFLNIMHRMTADEPEGLSVKYADTGEIISIIERKKKERDYGMCVVASSISVLDKYPDFALSGVDMFRPSGKNLANFVLVSPFPDADLSGYNDIVFLDTPSDFNVASLAGKRVYVNKDIVGYAKLARRISVERTELLSVFSTLRANAKKLVGKNAAEAALLLNGLGFDGYEFMFALSVFEELGLLAFKEDKIELYRGVKADLSDSVIYSRMKFLKDST